MLPACTTPCRSTSLLVFPVYSYSSSLRLLPITPPFDFYHPGPNFVSHPTFTHSLSQVTGGCLQVLIGTVRLIQPKLSRPCISHASKMSQRNPPVTRKLSEGTSTSGDVLYILSLALVVKCLFPSCRLSLQLSLLSEL
jgi:hypothetical protein